MLSGKGQCKLKLSGNRNECKPLPWGRWWAPTPAGSAAPHHFVSQLSLIVCSAGEAPGRQRNMQGGSGSGVQVH